LRRSSKGNRRAAKSASRSQRVVNRLNQGMRLRPDPTVIYGKHTNGQGIWGVVCAAAAAKETPFQHLRSFDALAAGTPFANPGRRA